jgi:hypothetical protein
VGVIQLDGTPILQRIVLFLKLDLMSQQLAKQLPRIVFDLRNATLSCLRTKQVFCSLSQFSPCRQVYVGVGSHCHVPGICFQSVIERVDCSKEGWAKSINAQRNNIHEVILHD